LCNGGEGGTVRTARDGDDERKLVSSVKGDVELGGGQSNSGYVGAFGERDDPLSELTGRAVGCVVDHALP
jgi:hypothetical protein